MKDVAILCEHCFDNGDWETMWPGNDHNDEPVWGVAEVETDDDGEWVLTWLASGLTVAHAEAHLGELEFGGPVRIMGK